MRVTLSSLSSIGSSTVSGTLLGFAANFSGYVTSLAGQKWLKDKAESELTQEELVCSLPAAFIATSYLVSCSQEMPEFKIAAIAGSLLATAFTACAHNNPPPKNRHFRYDIAKSFLSGAVTASLTASKTNEYIGLIIGTLTTVAVANL